MKIPSIIFLALLISTSSFAGDLDFLLKSESRYQKVFVEEVRGVNRFVIYNEDREKEVVRLIGLKPPADEHSRRKAPVERDDYGFRIQPAIDPDSPLEEQALNFAINLLDQKYVRLEFDSKKTDDEFNTLAYVFLFDSETFVNAEILRHGYAQLQVQPPNNKYREKLRAAYREGREELRGFHSQ